MNCDRNFAVQSSGDGAWGLSKLRYSQPQGLSTLFLVELWERFSYYGMRAILVYFMVAPVADGGLGFSTAEAALFYGNYTMAVYLLSLPGGYIADQYVGARRAVLIGGSVIALGHFSLAAGSLPAFYAGVVLIALGTGLFKPSISALVGSLYDANDERRDAGFTFFYMGINIGGFLAPLVTGFLAQSDTFKSWLVGQGFDPVLSWHWGFGAAGVGMAVSVALFAWRKSLFANAQGMFELGERGSWRQLALMLLASAILLVLLVVSDRSGFTWLRYIVVGLPVAAIVFFSLRGGAESTRIAAIFVFFVAAMLFWSAFEQAGLSIALFADKLTDNTLFGWVIPSAWYQSLNPLFVIMFAPVLGAGWIALGTRQPSTPIKFALGLGLLALSFLLMMFAARATADGLVSPMWLVLYFVLITLGELCLSPVGLSAMTKLAPLRFVSLMLGVWFLAAAFGNKLAGIFGAAFTADDPAGLTSFFGWFAALGGAAAVIMLVLTPWLRKQMAGVR